ncbi:hypothetical protein T458_15820 [Brevibacillus panacihumi W25]|uniref:Uncharacterized protein n=1 Tax=Brevibacillus panacihumi W25 TaxID=1408254 RepID=V6MAP9_9BACL|nr:hypothetical protein T458_15820 [Brevibacillus panacihumi W25]
MKSLLFFVLATILLIASGLIYTTERFIAYYSWIGQMQAHTGSFPTYPELPTFVTNGFVPFFLVGSVVLFVIGFRCK